MLLFPLNHPVGRQRYYNRANPLRRRIILSPHCNMTFVNCDMQKVNDWATAAVTMSADGTIGKIALYSVTKILREEHESNR